MKVYEPYFDDTNYNTPYTYFKYIIMSPVVLLRTLLIAADVSSFVLFIKLNIPFTRKYSTIVETLFCKLITFGFGFHNIKVKNKIYIQDAIKNNAIIVYNHVTYIDSFIICGSVYNYAPLIYYKYYNYIKCIIDYVDGICINDSKCGSSNSEKIIDHVNKRKRLLGIAPESVITNGKYLINFNTGAFITNSPILPIILKYPNKTNLSSCCNYSTLFKIYTILAQFNNNVEIELLPLQYKIEGETPREFADRVRKLMSETSGISMIDVVGRRDKYKSYKVYEDEIKLKRG